MSRWKRLASVDEQRWEKVRRVGRLGFVLLFGAGLFGLGGGLLFTIVMSLSLWRYSSIPEHIRLGLLSLGVWIAGGVWFGLLMWTVNEWLYKRQLREVGRKPTLPGTGDPDAG